MQLGQKRHRSQTLRLLAGKGKLENEVEMINPWVCDRWELMRSACPRAGADDEHTAGSESVLSGLFTESLPPEILTWDERHWENPDSASIHAKYEVRFDFKKEKWDHLSGRDENGKKSGSQ